MTIETPPWHRSAKYALSRRGQQMGTARVCLDVRGPEFVDKLATSLPGVYELRPRVIRDDRGSFTETYHREKFAGIGITDTFVQDNQSCSGRGTLRGLHYQLNHPQAKLCRVVEGEAIDVAVDIRLGSPHFGKWTSVLLSAKLQNEVYIPIGFAHGFLALTETVQFLYKCSDFYDNSDEYGVLWSDPDLNILWNIGEPRVSGKDSKYLKLAEIPLGLLPRYTAR
jgi:dTDP-4-dehydrorhamnose 3,5-epimerase